MVKKVVYPPKMRGRGPYDFTDSRDNNKQPSFFNKVRSFISFGKRALSETIGNEVRNGNGTIGDSSYHNNNNDNNINANNDTPLNSRPFKYQPPDASFISNITSRNTSRVSSLEARLSTSTNIDGPTDKTTLLKYLNSKGFSNLESEGILAVAKQLKDSDVDNEDTGETTLQKVDYLTHSNKFSRYLKAPSEDKKVPSDTKISPNNINNNHYNATTNNNHNNLISERSHNDTVSNDTSIFTISANNTAAQVMNSSIYSNTTMRRRKKRIYRYSEMGAPYKIGIPNKSLAIKGNSTLLDYNNSLIGNQSFMNTTNNIILPIENSASENASLLNNGNKKVSSTALALLETIEDSNKSKAASKLPPTESIKAKNSSYINPYANSHLSRVSKPRKPSRNFKKGLENDLLSSIEESATTKNGNILSDKIAKNEHGVPQPNFSIEIGKNLPSSAFAVEKAASTDQANTNDASTVENSVGLSKNHSKPGLISRKPVETEKKERQSSFLPEKPQEATGKKEVKSLCIAKSSEATEKKQTNSVLPFIKPTDVIDNMESKSSFLFGNTQDSKEIIQKSTNITKDKFTDIYSFEFDIKQKYDVADVVEDKVKKYKSVFTF